MKSPPGDSALLRDIAIAEIGRVPARDWSVSDGEFWCLVVPGGYAMPAQGWKLHVSATMLSAPIVLSRVVRVLAAEGCAFKFPARLGDYWELLAPHCPRGQAGKFVTAYPAGSAEAARLAPLLDEATWGLPGPAILSDHSYRPGGIVHYRYGAFGGHRVLGNDGFYEVRLRTPEGTTIHDERLPRFSPPSFATSPFTTPGTPGTPERRAVMLNGRFVVREAVRHANRGGVYIAEDTESGAEVVIKEGRPHASSDLGGRDARDRLAAERSRLEALASSGVVPAVVDFFEQGGHAFLVEELVPGTTLRRWSEGNAGPLGHDGFGNGAAEVLPILRRLVDALRAVHDLGHVFRDLSPDNVMLLPGGDLRLVDLEHATVPGDIVMIGGTPGYLAPELVPHTGELRPAPGETADLFGLGGLAYFLATGAGLELPEDGTTGPARGRRLLGHVAAVSASNPTLALLRPLVEGLVIEPEERWSLNRCAEFLDTLPPAAPATGLAATRETGGARVLAVPALAQVRTDGVRRADLLVADGLTRLVETMDPREDSPSPWPNAVGGAGAAGGTGGAEADPCSVNGGVPGILAVLTLASRATVTGNAITGSAVTRSAVTDDTAAIDNAVTGNAVRKSAITGSTVTDDTVMGNAITGNAITDDAAGVKGVADAAAGWLRRRLSDEDVWTPGLYFGRSGAVWALYDAAESSGDDEAREFALRAAARLPVDHPSSDVTHGLAGTGMTVLRLALRSGDPVLRKRAVETFENLHAARSYRTGHPRWPTPESFDSGLAGADHLGFAHGIAGVGTALLYAAVTLGRPEWMATVREVARALYERADVDGDTAWWPTLARDPRTVRPRRPHWCGGSSGIGSFLVRYWRATGDPDALRLAGQAAAAVHRTRWQSGAVPCHGLPGDGEFLLDMAGFTADDRYLRWAGDLAGCLEARAVTRSGRLLVPDSFSRVVPTFLGGTAGIVAFLLRLRHRHARPWMLDDVVGDSWRPPVQGSLPAPGRRREKRPAPGAATRSARR
ncbi:lanthionine synthetase LanC family protein [Streptosporangium sp. NPDC002524]|uniref:class III lanthionine synthetase LanKC N-terminal domain-containing protein n=1 Tax=Streptosporangium sp. NPDC002524 TaxID=3154537 RepID=UPI003328FA63